MQLIKTENIFQYIKICFFILIVHTVSFTQEKQAPWWQGDYEQGMAFLAERQFDLALQSFKTILAKNDKISAAHYGLGMVYAQNQANSKDAIDAFKKAIKYNENYIDAYYQLARVYNTLPEEENNALKYLREATKRDPSYQPAWFKMAEILLDLENVNHSLSAIKREVQQRPPFRETCTRFLVDSLQFRYPDASTTQLELFRARALFELENDTTGANAYWSAVDAIKDSGDVALVFRDISYIIENSEYAELQQTPFAQHGNFYKKFWLRRDPNLATEENERLPEHYKRLSHAYESYPRTRTSTTAVTSLHRFRHPFRRYTSLSDIMGEDMLKRLGFPDGIPKDRRIDDMGLVYIRHGNPDQQFTSVGQNVSLSDLTPKLLSFYMTDEAEMSENLNQMREWHFGFDMQPMSVSWKYYATSTRPEMVLHFSKYGDETGWIIEAVPSSLDNRETLGPKYHELRQTLISAQFAEIAMERIENQQGQDVQVSGIYNEMTLKIPKLITEVREENLDDIKSSLTTESSDFMFDNEPLEFRYELASFKGENDKNYIEIYYAIEGGRTKLAGNGTDTKLILEQSLVFQDKNSAQVVRVKEDENILVGMTEEQWQKRGLLGVKTLTLKPGSYDYEIHFRDKTANRLGVYKGEYKNENYHNPGLNMSDIVLIGDIRKSRGSEKFVKGDVAYNPRMFSSFKRNEKVGIYFEVYNLHVVNDNQNDFIIEYKLQPVAKKGFFKKVFGIFSGDKETVSSEYHYNSSKRDEKINLTFDLSSRPPGDYEITVKVKDLNAGKEMRKKVAINVN